MKQLSIMDGSTFIHIENSVKEHLYNTEVKVLSDVAFYALYFAQPFQIKKILVFVESPEVKNLISWPDVIIGKYNTLYDEKYKWGYRLASYLKSDFLNVYLENDEVFNIISINDIIKDYNDVVIVTPSNTCQELSQSITLSKNLDITYYSLSSSLESNSNSLTPLEEQIKTIAGADFKTVANEFYFDNKYQPIAHWIWLYNFLKYKKWILSEI